MKRPLFLCLLIFQFGCQSNPTPAPAQLEIEGAKILESGDFDRAFQVFEEVSRQPGRTYRAFIGLALARAGQGHSTEFENWSIRASAEAPTTPDAAIDLGRMYLQGARAFQKSLAGPRYASLGVEYLRRVFVADVHRARIVYELGIGLHLAGDREGALIMLDEALRRNPESYEVAYSYLLALQNSERPRRARAVLKAFETKGPLPEAWQSIRDWAEADRSE